MKRVFLNVDRFIAVHFGLFSGYFFFYFVRLLWLTTYEQEAGRKIKVPAASPHDGRLCMFTIVVIFSSRENIIQP